MKYILYNILYHLNYRSDGYTEPYFVWTFIIPVPLWSIYTYCFIYLKDYPFAMISTLISIIIVLIIPNIVIIHYAKYIFKYSIDVDPTLYKESLDWCKESYILYRINRLRYNKFSICFLSKKDVMAFKLRWS